MYDSIECTVNGMQAWPHLTTNLYLTAPYAMTSQASYGKWDVGMATPDHTPEGRGYHTGMNYFHHDNDYWSMAYQVIEHSPPVTSLSMVQLDRD